MEQNEETSKLPSATNLSTETEALPGSDDNITGAVLKTQSYNSALSEGLDDKQVSKTVQSKFNNNISEETFGRDDDLESDETDDEENSRSKDKDTAVQFVDANLVQEDDDASLQIEDLMFPETDEEVQHAKNLFSTVMDSERIKMMQFPSMLISGFGLRNYPSLCRALQHQQMLDEDYKRRKLKEEEEEMARLKKYREIERRQHRGEFRGESGTTYSNLGSQTDMSTMSGSSHQGTTAEQRRRIEYLMGLHGSGYGRDGEEDAGRSSMGSVDSRLKGDDAKSCGPEKDEPLTGTSDSMRQVQQYLRAHHIFEFFQFLIVHLLTKVPENPIEFLLLILDKLLIYRSGYGMAPLHYKERHLEQLFYLMDRMRTGYIDLQQYKTGMNTIGIKCFNSKPPLNKDGQVSKEFFLQEAYQCSCCVLNNIIRVRKVERSSKKKLPLFFNGGSQEDTNN